MIDLRQSKNHIVIIDGTLSTLNRGQETHCGKLFKLARRVDGISRRVYYDPGVQGHGWFKWLRVASGQGLNYSIARSYRRLSEHYRDGDRIYLFGYSRGAYAVRLMSGLISRFGLLRPEYATREFAENTLELFSSKLPHAVLEDYKNKYCIPSVSIEFLGVWDTVKALGLPIPFLRRYAPYGLKFRDFMVSRNVHCAAHALAIDENRRAYRPELWVSKAPNTILKQMLFSGTHSIVGGQTNNKVDASKLGNFSFQWMMDEAGQQGLELPGDWRDSFPTNAEVDVKPSKRFRFGLWRRENRKFIPPDLFMEHPSVQHHRMWLKQNLT